MNLRQSETGKIAGQKLDLGQQDSTPQFRKLRSIHEIFAKSLSNVLSTFLQAEIQAESGGAERNYRRGVPEESCKSKLFD